MKNRKNNKKPQKQQENLSQYSNIYVAAKGKPIDVKDVLDINDSYRLWYYIPQFQDYEISNDGYLRSKKHFRKYPYGILIRPISRANEFDPAYELPCSQNGVKTKVTIRRSQLMHLASQYSHRLPGYPRYTNNTPIDEDVMRTNIRDIRNKIELPPLNNTELRYPKFTIVEDPNEGFGREMRIPQKYVPVYNIVDPNVYYGRVNCQFVHTLDEPDMKGFSYYAGDYKGTIFT